MFRRMASRLLRKKLTCCLAPFLRKSRTYDEDLEEKELYEKEETKVDWQAPSNVAKQTAEVEKQPYNQQLIDDNFVSVVEDLAAEEFVTSRIFACRMACLYYGRVTPRARDQLRSILKRLREDDNLQVRRTAISALTYMEKEADIKSYTSSIMSALEKYIEEEKVGVSQRGALMLIDVSTYPQLSEDMREAVIPVLLKYSRHPSWEVRHMIANSVLEVLKSLRAQAFKSLLTGVLRTLLADSEPVVRTTVDNQVEAYYNYLIELPEMFS